jgi:hypothetical protein
LFSFALEGEFLFGKDISEHIYSLREMQHFGHPWVSGDKFVAPFRKYMLLK